MRRTPLLTTFSLLACLALSTPALAAGEISIVPQGPGTIFSTVESAVVDGLAYAHKAQLESSDQRISRGGAILPLNGGYTYRALDVASASSPDRVPLRLPESAVAHFHTYPWQTAPANRSNESHSEADRSVVDYRDSKHRPSYVLTPSLRVVSYEGREMAPKLGPATKDLLVADLTGPADITRIASRN
jgi:hypothetical protein